MANLQKFLAQAKDWAITHKAVEGNDYHKQQDLLYSWHVLRQMFS